MTDSVGDETSMETLTSSGPSPTFTTKPQFFRHLDHSGVHSQYTTEHGLQPSLGA
jgi:hypothetical protein